MYLPTFVCCMCTSDSMSKKILVAPLNWGLGHATRCIPLINELIRQGAEVILASDGRAYDLLAIEYPDLPLLRLPSYEIHYHRSSMVMNMATQSLKVLSAIRQERQMIAAYVQDKKIDIVVSDNRYGCHHPDTRNIFITHQIHLHLPWWFAPAKWVNRKWIRRFDECWIPDNAGETNISGALSRPPLSNMPTHYLGLLSRMRYYQRPVRYDVVVVLSGPEPQRSVLESKILQQARELPQRFLIVQGKPPKKKHYFDSHHIEIISYLPTKELNDAMLSGEIIISRSGYSTIMDLVRLGKKAFLIPTPGQTEQEYLAGFFSRKGIYYSQPQSKLDIAKGLQEVSAFPGLPGSAFPAPDLSVWVKQLLS